MQAFFLIAFVFSTVATIDTFIEYVKEPNRFDLIAFLGGVMMSCMAIILALGVRV